MRLIEYPIHDDPRRDGRFPAAGCAICGHQVAVAPAELGGAAHVDELPPEMQLEVLALLAAWSQEHAKGHSTAELERNQQLLEEGTHRIGWGAEQQPAAG